VVRVDHGRDVERADAWMHAPLPAKVDEIERHARAAREGGRELALSSGEREHAAVVIGVAMDVEQADDAPRRRRQRTSELRDRALVRAGARIRHGEKRGVREGGRQHERGRARARPSSATRAGAVTEAAVGQGKAKAKGHAKKAKQASGKGKKASGEGQEARSPAADDRSARRRSAPDRRRR
jgi:hypothetical protein